MWNKIRATLQNRMSSSPSSSTSSVQISKRESGGWKWEVNHDGVVWSWYHPYPEVSSNDSKRSTTTSSTSQVSEIKITSDVSEKRYSMIDYWYTVHDGTVIPTINDY